MLIYSTYLGGSAQDYARAIAVDSSESAYVTGQTFSADFPTPGPYETDQLVDDVFVTKLSAFGNSLVYSTYLGGIGSDRGNGIAVDSLGSAYVVGTTSSTDFPTQNPFQTNQSGGDGFVTKLSPSGDSLVYSTYLGGGAEDYANAIAVDSSESAYVTGETLSADFPTQSPYQTDQPSNDAFVTKLSPAGNTLVYSTYLGGSAGESGLGIAVDGAGSAYVSGFTASADFPTQNPFQTDQPTTDAFVAKLSPAGNTLVYSTYLGGNSGDTGWSIAVDVQGSAYVAGHTQSTDFPTQNPFQTDQPAFDAFVAKLSPPGNTLVYSTYLGGNGSDQGAAIALDRWGSAYVVGWTSSTDFPLQNPYQGDQGLDDAFVTKFSSRPMDYFTLSPCRLVDTRNAVDPYGGPALIAGADRAFTLVGRCGIPLTARAVSGTLAVTQPSTAGNLRLYPTAAIVPVVSTINYSAGQTRSSNAIVSLDSSGVMTVRCAQASGTAHFVLDVNGYFQ